MKITFLGALFMFFSFLGFYAAGREKRKIKIANELSRLLGYMDVQISNYRRELEDIFIDFESPLLDKCGFSQKLGSEGFSSAVKYLDIDKESKDSLLEFSKTLGLLSGDDQKASILRCRNELDNNLQKARAEYPQKRKLYISFGVMIGALVFIFGI